MARTARPPEMSWEEWRSTLAKQRMTLEAELERAVHREEMRLEKELWEMEHPTAEEIIFVGTCDVCGAVIWMNFCFGRDGMIDYNILMMRDGSSKLQTWIRHIENKFVNADCNRYSSEVFEQYRQGVNNDAVHSRAPSRSDFQTE